MVRQVRFSREDAGGFEPPEPRDDFDFDEFHDLLLDGSLPVKQNRPAARTGRCRKRDGRWRRRQRDWPLERGPDDPADAPSV